MNKELIKRSKSLMWRLGMVALAFLLTGVVEEILPILDIPVEIKGIIGLVFGEISKHLNK